jgi:hypothetical protein
VYQKLAGFQLQKGWDVGERARKAVIDAPPTLW